MTRGGPGFTSDVIASVIYKQYQVGLLRPLDRRERRAVPRGDRDRAAAVVVPEPQGGRPVNVAAQPAAQRRWRSSLFARRLRRPVPLHRRAVAQGPRRRPDARLQLAQRDRALAEPPGGHRRARLHAGDRVREQHDPHGRERHAHGGLRGDGRLRAAAPASRGGRASSTSSCCPGSSSRRRSCPTIWVLQGLGLFRTLPGLILVEVAFGLSFCVLLFRAFIVTVPRGARRGRDHRRGRPAAAVLPGGLPAAAAGGRDRDRRAVGGRLQRLRQPAVLPAGRRRTPRSS